MAASGLGLEITELRLGLPGAGVVIGNDKKRVFSQIEGGDEDGVEKKKSSGNAKSQQQQQQKVVVGWPPVCSFRRKNSFKKADDEDQSSKMYVKVSMDGAPFLRKINLVALKDYSDLEMALEKLFGSCFKVGTAEDWSSEYVPIYEDKEGDWMLVGDVPWTMFIESCKKLRIMKKTEAIGIGLRCAKEISNDA